MKTSYGHLTYCTNIHAGETWPDHFSALRQNFPRIKSQVSPNAPMGLGLRLSNIASEQLTVKEELAAFTTWLKENETYIYTMNGFPYGGFHNTIVKDQVHAPDWTTKERVEYTKRLFNILAELLPENMDGGVSTSPLSYRYWFSTPEAFSKAKETATQNILDIVIHLADIATATGKILHLDIEPEPDGILETGPEFIEWYKKELLIAGTKRLVSLYSITGEEAEKLVKRHIRLCYDVCHFAIGYEPHQAIINQLHKEGIQIGKFQISAALKAMMEGDAEARLAIKQAFTSFNETTYLHQVVARKKDGEFQRYPDLPKALEDAENALVIEWRAHFHVPIFQEDLGLLQSTQSDITDILEIQKKQAVTNHLEIETYTWEVLPENLKLPIQDLIIRELQWVNNQLL